MPLIGISRDSTLSLWTRSISALLSCLSGLAVVCASLALPVLGRTRGRNSRGLLVHRRLGDPFGSVYAKSPSIKLSCFTLETCISLFSTVQREGQLSGKPTRPSTSYRQPARASSGDAPAAAVLSGLHDRSEGVRTIAGCADLATPSIAVAAPRQFAFLKLHGS
jgi:hypothetical protein